MLRCRHRYENDPTSDEQTDGFNAPNGMTFTCADVLTAQFWEQLRLGKEGAYGSLPMPDAIHASPDCSPFSWLTKVAGQDLQREGTGSVDFLIRELKRYERTRAVQSSRSRAAGAP